VQGAFLANGVPPIQNLSRAKEARMVSRPAGALWAPRGWPSGGGREKRKQGAVAEPAGAGWGCSKGPGGGGRRVRFDASLMWRWHGA
jgi:hypothetical protein